ncbi:MAG: AAA family ATPase, partial [Gaiellales bacterium]
LADELAAVREEAAGLRTHWDEEKRRIQAIQRLKQAVEETRAAAERAQRDGDLQRAAELTYGDAPALAKELEAEEHGLAVLQGEVRMLKEEVDAEDIAEVVATWTGIPVTQLMEGELEKLVLLEQRLHEKVIGQDEAVGAVSDAIRRSRAGLSDPDRPIGSFLFLGPTGVGKTELARALALLMFDDERAMVRIDMSEYGERHNVSRLIGAPPGYIGFEGGGQLTEAVRRRPYAVVLLDEVEKAHADVFNVLLQVLDDGRLTDGQGRTVDFRNVVMIMTSNVGSDAILSANDTAELRERVETALRATFRPEFLNRIDETVIFHRLGREELREIVDLQLARVVERLAARRIVLELTDAAREAIAEGGYDPAFGARPLKRAIQRMVENPLALRLLEGGAKDGDTVLVDAGPDGLDVRIEHGEPAAV